MVIPDERLFVILDIHFNDPPIFAFLTTKSYLERYAVAVVVVAVAVACSLFFLPFLDFLFDLWFRIFVAMRIISCA